MNLLLPIHLKKNSVSISYPDQVMMIGSCFTEHIGNALKELKFPVLQNPNGILFGPDSVCTALESYIENKAFEAENLFYLNEVWNSWDHHSRYSHINKNECLKQINLSQQQAHHFLKSANWLIVTMGSSFIYNLLENDSNEINRSVANCHRAPASWFNKELMEIEEVKFILDGCLAKMRNFNPLLKVIFTVSPVRHIRDGVVENNRSKARLLEAIHSIVEHNDQAYYFPAYELVIDVLRDYRFYDIDLVHPNYAATQFVLDKFAEVFISEESISMMEEIRKIVIARKHRAFQENTNAHRQFLQSHFEKVTDLQKKYPFLNLKEELIYFSRT